MARLNIRPLHLALGVSVAVHAVLLVVRFVDPESFNRVFQDTPLEVILVNARSADRPDRAQAIAQANLAGGGEAERGRATSPLPPSALTELGDAAEAAQRHIEAMQDQQMSLLTQLRRDLSTLPPSDPRQAAQSNEAKAQEEKRKQLAKLLAEIERRVNEENARPKKRYISPATREEVYATYYDALRRRIEEKGTNQFPTLAGKKLYGELTMVITVNHDGRVLATEIVESSSSDALNRRAQSIAQTAGPYGAFSPAMRRRADQIVVVSRFRFTRDQTLETRLSAPGAEAATGKP